MNTSFEGQLKDIFIIAKTYPHPSQHHGELVCTAGIMDGALARFYPVPYRYLEPEQMYEKYAWIRARVTRPPASKDRRIDSYRPDAETIQVVQRPKIPIDWDERYHLIVPLVSPSLEHIKEAYDRQMRSLGILKPATVDMEIRESTGAWRPKQQQALRQMRMFDGPPKELIKIPWDFRYMYRCRDKRCKGHTQLITDWELGAAFLKWRKGYTEERALAMIQEKWVDFMWRQRDSYLIVGSTWPKPSFIVIGVFYPPRMPTRQSRII